MKRACRVLVAGHDKGALSVLGALLTAWIDDPRVEAQYIATPAVMREIAWSAPAARPVPWAYELTESVASDPAALDLVLAAHLRRADWDAVLCGTSESATLERRILQLANAVGIPSLAYCDMWWAYAQRFSSAGRWVVPEVVLAVDGRMVAEIAQLAWPKLPKIIAVGHPFYEKTRQTRLASRGESLRFLSQPASTRFPAARVDEFRIAAMVLRALRSGGNERRLVVRPHPTDAMEPWRRFAWRHRHEGVALDALPLEACLPDTWAAVGISTVLLIEMALAGIPAASVQLPDADPAYYALPFEDFGIARLSDGDALTRWLAAPPTPTADLGQSVSGDAVARITDVVLDTADAAGPAMAAGF